MKIELNSSVGCIPGNVLSLTRSPGVAGLGGEDLGCPDVEGFSTDGESSGEECSGGGDELHFCVKMR